MANLQSIRKLGFRRWYERLLIEAHAWLVSCFLALVLAVALFETHNETAVLIQRIPLLTGAAFCVVGAWFAYRRYFLSLQRAEIFGEGASCPRCTAYGKLQVESIRQDAAGDVIQVAACCRKCGHQWRIGE